MLLLAFACAPIPDLKAETTSAQTITVSPGGKVATLPAARDAVRALRAAGEKGNIDVVIQDGVYRLDSTLVFGPEDSAPKGAVTRYRAAEGASPLISGGRVIINWEKSDLQGGKVWRAKVPWAKGDAFFHCLYDGSKLLQRAQSEGIRVEADSPKKEYAGELKHRLDFSFTGEVLKPCKNLEDLELYGQPTRAWLVNFLGIASVDPGEINGPGWRFRPPTGWVRIVCVWKTGSMIWISRVNGRSTRRKACSITGRKSGARRAIRSSPRR